MRATAMVAASSSTACPPRRRPPARRGARCPRGAYWPRPPPSIMAGPPMPMLAPSVAMTTSQQPSRAALPAKNTGPRDADQGDGAAEGGRNRWKARASKPDTPGASVSPGRPPPPSAKSTTGSGPTLGELEEPVFLAVVLEALGPGQDGVVVGGHHDRPTVDAPDPADQAVGRRAGDEGRRRPGGGAGGDGQGGELHDAA